MNTTIWKAIIAGYIHLKRFIMPSLYLCVRDIHEKSNEVPYDHQIRKNTFSTLRSEPSVMLSQKKTDHADECHSCKLIHAFYCIG